MNTRHIVAGFVAALVFCVSSLAAACDLSCGFASLRSDCHSSQMGMDDPGSPGMVMAGMPMSEAADPDASNQQTVSPVP